MSSSGFDAARRVLFGEHDAGDVAEARMFFHDCASLIERGGTVPVEYRETVGRLVRFFAFGAVPAALIPPKTEGRPDKQAQAIALAAMVRILEIAGYSHADAKHVIADAGTPRGIRAIEVAIAPYRFPATDEPTSEVCALVLWAKGDPALWRRLLPPEVAERCDAWWAAEIARAREDANAN